MTVGERLKDKRQWKKWTRTKKSHFLSLPLFLSLSFLNGFSSYLSTSVKETERESWAAVNRNFKPRHTQKKTITTTASIVQTHLSTTHHSPVEVNLYLPPESHPSRSFPLQTSKLPPTTSALISSSPKAAKKPPILSTRAVYRTVGGSPSRNSLNWPGLIQNNSRWFKILTMGIYFSLIPCSSLWFFMIFFCDGF